MNGNPLNPQVVEYLRKRQQERERAIGGAHLADEFREASRQMGSIHGELPGTPSKELAVEGAKQNTNMMDPLVMDYLKKRNAPPDSEKLRYMPLQMADEAGDPYYGVFDRVSGGMRKARFGSRDEASSAASGVRGDAPGAFGGSQTASDGAAGSVGSPRPYKKPEQSAEEKAKERVTIKQAEQDIIRKPTKPMADELAEADAAARQLQALVQSYSNNNMGSFAKGLQSMVPSQWGKAVGMDNSAQKFVANSKQAAQAVGLFLEGGKLQANDYPRYRMEQLPNEQDTPEIAQEKAQALHKQLLTKIKAKIKGYREAGYDVSGLERLLQQAEGLDMSINAGGETKTLNGKTYKKVDGGWQRVK